MGSTRNTARHRADGRIAQDFRGRLSFSWSRRATQYALHRDQPGYDPLFPFGVGLGYREGRELPPLPEDPGLEEQP